MKRSEVLARRYFEAVGGGDRAALRDLLSDTVVYRFPGRSSFAKTYEGRDEVLAYLDRLRETTGGSMSVRVLDVMVSDARTTGLVQATAARDGRTLTWELAAVILASDDAIEEIEIFYNDQYGVDEFLS